MKNLKTVLQILFLMLLTLNVFGQNVEWVKEASPHNIANTPFNFKKVIPDGTGNLYAYGTLKATSNYNGTVLTPISSFAGSSFNNSFIMKLDTAGNVLWHKIITGPGTSNNTIKDIVVGVNNDLILLAAASNFVIVDVDTFQTGSASYQHLAVVFRNNGTYKGLSASINQPPPFSIEKIFFNNNAIYAIGGQPANGLGSFIWKYDTSLVVQWQVSTNNGWDEFTDLDFLSDSSIIAIGYDGTAGPSGLTIDTLVHSTSQIGVRNFYTKIDHATGHAIWVNVIGNTTAVGNITSVRIDNADNIYMAGVLSASNQLFYFGNDTIGNPSIISNNGPAYILKADASGNGIWGSDFYAGSIGLSFLKTTLLLDDLNNAYLFPYITFGTITEPGHLPYFNYTNPGSVCFIKVNSSGNLQYGKSYNNIGAAQTDGSFSSASFLNGKMYVTGTWVGNGPNQMKLGCHRTEDSGYLIMISDNNEPVPVAGFDFIIDEGKAYFTNTTLNADSIFHWDFGNGQTSTKVNPSYQYTTPGSYNVCLTSESVCGIDTVCYNVVNQGIERVNPTNISQNGFHMLFIHGGFPAITNGTVKLIKSGQPDIIPDTVYFISNSVIKAKFVLANAAIGSYDVVINSSSFNDTLYSAISIETNYEQLPEIEISIPNATLVNRYGVYRLRVTNKGNTTLFAVPVYIQMRGHFDNVIISEMMNDSINNAIYDSIPERFTLYHDNITSDSMRVGLFAIPMLMSGETKVLEFRTISSLIGTFDLSAGTSAPLFTGTEFNNPLARASVTSCGFPKCLDCLIEYAGLLPGVGCILNGLSLACSINNYAHDLATNDNPKHLKGVMDIVGNLGQTAISCGTGMNLATLSQKFSGAVIKSINPNPLDLFNMINTCGIAWFTAISDCIPGCKTVPTYWVGSLDPNTKTGPVGHNSFNYIKGDEKYNYTIYFENADTATAPATEVVVTDTIDKNLIDISSIAFSSFGFGDSLYIISGNKSSFVQEIDLNPSKNIILRVAGTLDTASGILTCRYSSFDPVTMALTDSVSQGFLPPNINYPEGEGHIAFSYKLKSGLTHLQAINNKATIVFDNNAPIITPNWLNTIDIVKPTSNILPLTVNTIDTVITLHINGVDADAGISHYDIYVSINDTAYFRLASNYAGDSIMVIGENGSKYEFFSIATDHAGNIEDPPLNPETNPDAVTTITVGLNELETNMEFSLKPNPTNAFTDLIISSPQYGWYSIAIMDLEGRILQQHEIQKNNPVITYRLQTKQFTSGTYLIQLTGKEGKQTRKLFIIHP